MKRVLMMAVLLSMLSSLGMSAQNDLDDHPNMPKFVNRYKEALRKVQQFDTISEKNPHQEERQPKSPR